MDRFERKDMNFPNAGQPRVADNSEQKSGAPAKIERTSITRSNDPQIQIPQSIREAITPPNLLDSRSMNMSPPAKSTPTPKSVQRASSISPAPVAQSQQPKIQEKETPAIGLIIAVTVGVLCLSVFVWLIFSH